MKNRNRYNWLRWMARITGILIVAGVYPEFIQQASFNESKYLKNQLNNIGEEIIS